MTSFYDEQLPVAVYGTLRPGSWNHERLFGDGTLVEQWIEGTVPSYGLWDVGVPMAYRSRFPCNPLVVDVAFIRLGKSGTDLRKQLDALEGFDPHRPDSGVYRRERVRVTSEDGPLETWIYVCSNESLLYTAERITSGDYLNPQPPIERLGMPTRVGPGSPTRFGPTLDLLVLAFVVSSKTSTKGLGESEIKGGVIRKYASWVSRWRINSGVS